MRFNAKLKKLFSIFIGLGFIAYLYWSPVLVRVPLLEEEHTGEPLLVLFNPLRRREPERYAENILREMRRGNCVKTLESARDMDDQDRKNRCELIAEFGLTQWQLRNRRDNKRECELYYWHQGDEGLRIILKKPGDNWQLSRFAIIY